MRVVSSIASVQMEAEKKEGKRGNTRATVGSATGVYLLVWGLCGKGWFRECRSMNDAKCV